MITKHLAGSWAAKKMVSRGHQHTNCTAALFSRRILSTTLMLLNALEALAITGESSQPVTGDSTPAESAVTRTGHIAQFAQNQFDTAHTRSALAGMDPRQCESIFISTD